MENKLVVKFNDETATLNEDFTWDSTSLDLAKELTMVLSVFIYTPDMGDRYHAIGHYLDDAIPGLSIVNWPVIEKTDGEIIY